MCCEDDVHCGVWYWWGIIASRCTAKADGKRCLLMHVPAAPPSSSAQEKTTSLRDTEPHHSIGNARSHTHLLTVTDLLPRWQWEILEHLPYSPDVSMRLRSLRQSERTTARDPVQHKRWTYPCYMAVNTEHQQRWTRWWCTTPSKPLLKGDK